MISVYNLKKNFQNILRPLSDYMFKIGITANMVTITAFILSVVVGFGLFYLSSCSSLFFLIMPIFLFVRMALNAIDGMLAREHNQKSNIGAIYNELGDILSDCALYVPLLIVLGVDHYLIMVFIVLCIVSETVGIIGCQINASRHYEGPMGKSDRAFYIGTLCTVLAFYSVGVLYLQIFVGIVSLLLIYTTVNRVRGELKEVAKQD